MRQGSIKFAACSFFLFSLPFSAVEAIKINVKTNEQSAAAIGFVVDGKKSGSRGKSHSGTGPVNKEYTFGYRKYFALGPDVLCGSVTLAKDTSVTLVTNGSQCSIQLE